jgi:hypothetical protein
VHGRDERVGVSIQSSQLGSDALFVLTLLLGRLAILHIQLRIGHHRRRNPQIFRWKC